MKRCEQRQMNLVPAAFFFVFPREGSGIDKKKASVATRAAWDLLSVTMGHFCWNPRNFELAKREHNTTVWSFQCCFVA